MARGANRIQEQRRVGSGAKRRTEKQAVIGCGNRIGKCDLSKANARLHLHSPSPSKLNPVRI